jgi:ribose 1,5-bisphosphokinase PhnN
LLRQRLLDRGRENDEQIRARLRRNAQFMHLEAAGDGGPMLVVDNSTDVDSTIQALYARLKQTPAHANASRLARLDDRSSACG